LSICFIGHKHTHESCSVLMPILLSHVSQRHIPFLGEGTTYGHAFYCDSWEQASLGTSLWPPWLYFYHIPKHQPTLK
jgi:hypothetical protein